MNCSGTPPLLPRCRQLPRCQQAPLRARLLSLKHPFDSMSSCSKGAVGCVFYLAFKNDLSRCVLPLFGSEDKKSCRWKQNSSSWWMIFMCLFEKQEFQNGNRIQFWKLILCRGCQQQKPAWLSLFKGPPVLPLNFVVEVNKGKRSYLIPSLLGIGSRVEMSQPAFGPGHNCNSLRTSLVAPSLMSWRRVTATRAFKDLGIQAGKFLGKNAECGKTSLE